MRSNFYPVDKIKEGTEATAEAKIIDFTCLSSCLGSLITLVHWTNVASHHTVMFLWGNAKERVREERERSEREKNIIGNIGKSIIIKPEYI